MPARAVADWSWLPSIVAAARARNAPDPIAMKGGDD